MKAIKKVTNERKGEKRHELEVRRQDAGQGRVRVRRDGVSREGGKESWPKTRNNVNG